ncbi:hypothetical protein [Streptomyces sp. NPDC001436]
MRRTAVTARVLFLVTEVAVLAGAVLYRPLLGTGVTLFPVVRHWGETAALGYLCARVMPAWEVSLAVWLVARGFRPAVTPR